MTNYEQMRYGKTLRVTDQSEAVRYFNNLVSENMRAAGRARTRQEAETIERRRIERFINRSECDLDTRRRAAKLFGVDEPAADSACEKEPSVERAPSRPSPSVQRIGAGFHITSEHLDAMRRITGNSTLAAPNVRQNGLRRDRWRPWMIASETPPAERIEWRPWQWTD